MTTKYAQNCLQLLVEPAYVVLCSMMFRDIKERQHSEVLFGTRIKDCILVCSYTSQSASKRLKHVNVLLGAMCENTPMKLSYVQSKGSLREATDSFN